MIFYMQTTHQCLITSCIWFGPKRCIYAKRTSLLTLVSVIKRIRVLPPVISIHPHETVYGLETNEQL